MEKRTMHRRKALQALAAGGLGVALLSRRLSSQVFAGAVEVAKVPAKVREAAEVIVPGAKWTAADSSKEDGQVVYELEGTDGKGRKVYVEVSADGTVTEVQTKIALTDPPIAVWEAVAKSQPTFEAATAYEVRSGDKLLRPGDGDLSYEVSGMYQKNRQVIFEVTPAGEITEIERDVSVSDVPKVVMDALQKKLPKFKATSATELTEGGTVTGYHLEGKRPKDKKDTAVFVSADGKEVQVEDE